MPGTGPEVAVFDSGLCDGAADADGEAWRADPGGSAVLYGMVATIAEVIERLEARLDRIEASVARPDTSALEARVAAVADAVASMPIPVLDLDALVAAIKERLLTHATAADEALGADLRVSFQRTAEMASTIHAVHDTLQALGEQVARLAMDERARPVLEALEAMGRQNQEAVFTLQTALVRRIDGRTAALARLMESTGDLGPLLGRLVAAIDDQEARGREAVESLRSMATAVRAALHAHVTHVEDSAG